MFYQSVVVSIIFFAVVCWGAGIKAKVANRLNKLIKVKSGMSLSVKLSVSFRTCKHIYTTATV